MTGPLLALLLTTQADTLVSVDSSQAVADSVAMPGDDRWTLTDAPRPSPARLWTIGATVGVSAAAINVWQRRIWWQDRTAEFRVMNDPDYARNVDKLGHAWTGLIVSDALRGSFRWAGLGPWRSTLLGAGISWLYLLNIEVQDGWGTNYGFSPGDVLANSVGAFYPVAQQAVPPLRHVHLKWSYRPSPYLGKSKLPGGDDRIAFVDDYEGHTYWLTADVHHLLPRSARRYWPEWLGVAVGAGVEHLDIGRYGYGNGVREIYLAPDLNLLPLARRGPRWRVAAELFNHLHLPAPAVRLRPGAPVWYGLTF